MGMGPGSFAACDVAAIRASTDNLPADPADASDIAAQNDVIAGHLEANR